MPDEREYQSLVKDAERAVGASDFARANVTLREALRLQEAALGALHPEVASTLNNLAVVSETLGRMDEAEGYFRRAYAIASAALPPNDPLVVTSRENLKDFCAAVDHPLEDWPDLELSHAAPTVAPPAAPPAAPAPAPPPWATAAPPRHSAAPAPTRAPAPTPVRARTSARASAPPAAASTAPRRPGSPVRTGQRSWTAPMMGVLAVLAIVGALVAARSWRAASSDERAAAVAPAAPGPVSPPVDTSPDAQGAPSPSAPATREAAPIASAAPATAAESADEAATPSAAPAVSEAPPPAAASSPRGAAPAVNSTDVRVVIASVCASLSTTGPWSCQAAGDPAAPGRAAFYTRVASPTAMRLQHRWYQGSTLRQNVTLSIAANPSAGYRTFSRQTLSPGSWRVELRDEDGSLLHEIAFEVR